MKTWLRLITNFYGIANWNWHSKTKSIEKANTDDGRIQNSRMLWIWQKRLRVTVLQVRYSGQQTNDKLALNAESS